MRFGLLRISKNLRQFVNFNGETSNYLEYLYYVYRTDPNHLQKSWQSYFSFLEQGKNYPVHHFDRNVTFKNIPLLINKTTSQASELIAKVTEGVTGPEVLKLNELASAYRTYGHLVSKLDPLDLPKRVPFFRIVEGIDERLNIKNYKLTTEDLSKKVPNLGLGGIFNSEGTVQSQIDKLRERYCGNISFEFGHITDSEAVAFLMDQIESDNFLNLSKEESLNCFKSICRAVKFEHFCAKAFPTLKRFGMDGMESLLVLLESIEKWSREFGAKSILMTMSHRGRLGVLSNFLNKPLEESFAEFRGANWFVDCNFRSGDVKYHNGYSCVKNGLEIQMISNSSHLQFSHPVLTGLVKAKQHYEKDVKKNKTVPIAIHGNSAISGQGMPYEVVQMSKIKGFTIGGTINIVVNNQIGFTANQLEASSSRYPTDVAKVIEAPVIHVNSYSIESAVFAGRLACLYRQKFHTDVFINLVGFRRFGHNELDMPKFTNAEMYHKVDQVPNLMVYYKDYLNSKMGIDMEELNKIENSTGSDFQKSLELSKSIERIKEPIQNENWRSILKLIEAFHFDNSLHNRVMERIAASKDSRKGVIQPNAKKNQLTLNPEVLRTGLDRKLLLSLGLKCNTIPPEIKMHNSIKKIFDQRIQALNNGTGIDTAISEVLAFSSLSNDGFHVRLSGQESKRGTFSHRHAEVQCQETFKYHSVFEGMDVRILNSYLSELAAVGFEYGYSLYSPKTLNIWEAQFGDFVNGAQVIIDSFITSAETKWNYFSGVVMFLPHGYDGQGPDHSSCRIERFLQSSNDSEDLSDNLGLGEDYAKLVNISVVNCSMSSNLFHVLRRQMHRPFRKPLICVTGKKLLKLRGAFCNLSEFETGTFFRRYIPDPLYNPNIMDHLYHGVPGAAKASGSNSKVDGKQLDKVEKVIMCSGQIYYDLLEFRESNKGAHKNLENVAISRLEEITPFPAQWVLDDLRLYKNLKSVVWCQEEHENGGCYHFVRQRLNNLLNILRDKYGSKVDVSVKYAGRLPCATTAVGDPKTHNDEHALVEGAFYI